MTITNSSTVVVSYSNEQLLGAPLLLAEGEEAYLVADAVDYKHRSAKRSKHGLWRSAGYIIGAEIAERIAYFGIAGNLIKFLTRRLGQSTALAAANVNAWIGVSAMLPVLGAIIADSYLGKYYTIVAASLLYILGLGLLTLSAALPSLSCLDHERSNGTIECSSNWQIMLVFAALYLVGLGIGGLKPCFQAFGADQFDGEDPTERKAQSSFFNWYFFASSCGALLGMGILTYIQDNLSWGLGFGIPCITMVISLVIFLVATSTYRFIKQGDRLSSFLRIGRVFVLASKNWRSTLLEDKEQHHGSQKFRFLDKALFEPNISKGGVGCIKSDIMEAKALLRLFPIWATSLAFAIVFSQTTTFFTKQGVTLDRSMGSSFAIPAASLRIISCICIVIVIPMYDCLLVPVARIVTGKPAGISMLQRIGTGLFVSMISMTVAAFIEKMRLKTAMQHGLINFPDVTVPMSIWWLLPQYALCGIAEAFTMVGLQEFFYDQVPKELRSLGMSLFCSIFGIGALLSSVLVSLIDKATSEDATESDTSWFSDNLNRGHLDYFYWLLAGLSAIGLALFLHVSKSYIYNKNNTRT